MKIIERFSPPVANLQEPCYNGDHIIAYDHNQSQLAIMEPHIKQLDQISKELQTVFSAELGFAPISQLNYTDGIRMSFANGDVAHIRPSGNADELRIYSVADTQERADAIASKGVAEPDGLFRRLEAIV